MYELLGILNDKAEALLAYNGIILAVVTLVTVQPTDVRWFVTGDGLKTAIVVMTLASILNCLFVIAVFWGFLERAHPPGPAAAAAIDDEWKALRQVLVFRERCFQFAWWMALLVLPLLLWFYLDFRN